MERTAFLKAKARLEAFKLNLPKKFIGENYVQEYHEILDRISEQTSETFDDFRIPDSAIFKRIRTWTGSLTDPLVSRTPNYTKTRYCDYALFAMKLDGAIIFIGYMAPKSS